MFASLCHNARRIIISERLQTGRTARREMIQTLDLQYMTHIYAIGYPGPVFNHLATNSITFFSPLYSLLYTFWMICIITKN